jgi:hypothetical protein
VRAESGTLGGTDDVIAAGAAAPPVAGSSALTSTAARSGRSLRAAGGALLPLARSAGGALELARVRSNRACAAGAWGSGPRAVAGAGVCSGGAAFTATMRDGVALGAYTGPTAVTILGGALDETSRCGSTGTGGVLSM